VPIPSARSALELLIQPTFFIFLKNGRSKVLMGADMKPRGLCPGGYSSDQKSYKGGFQIHQTNWPASVKAESCGTVLYPEYLHCSAHILHKTRSVHPHRPGWPYPLSFGNLMASLISNKYNGPEAPSGPGRLVSPSFEKGFFFFFFFFFAVISLHPGKRRAGCNGRYFR